MADYETVVLTKEVACSPERLFHVLTDRDLRQKWSAPSDEAEVIIDEFDCRAGGHEVIRCGPKEEPEFNTIGNFHVVEPEFMCFTETLFVGGTMLSVALCSHEISATDTGSALTVTLQITSLCGAEMFADYGTGWTSALDGLATLAEGAELVH